MVAFDDPQAGEHQFSVSGVLEECHLSMRLDENSSYHVHLALNSSTMRDLFDQVEESE